MELLLGLGAMAEGAWNRQPTGGCRCRKAGRRRAPWGFLLRDGEGAESSAATMAGPWRRGKRRADGHVEGGAELLVSTGSHVGRRVPWIRAGGACSKGLGQRPSREVEAPWTGSIGTGRKKTAWGGKERLLAAVVSLGVGVQNCQVQGERAPIYRHGLGLGFLSGPNVLDGLGPKR
jgi:hypothetical protein